MTAPIYPFPPKISAALLSATLNLHLPKAAVQFSNLTLNTRRDFRLLLFHAHNCAVERL
jgi:hypothetical protein